MTREELIRYGKDYLRDLVNACCEISDKHMEFVRQSIKALEQISNPKEAYRKGYKDGQEALAFHLELCKDEGSIITVPEGATNGDMIKTMFPDAEVIAVENEEMEIVEYVVKIDVETVFTEEWWNSPYRKER